MSQGERRLATVMFTDMVGYTKLGQKDEANALRLLEEQRKILRRIFPRYNGWELKTIGDGFLVEFSSVLDGVRCAAEIQKVLRERNEISSIDSKILVRIRLHLGDVVHTHGDIQGDAVNLASRIEPLAEPGGVCVSGQVFDQVQNKLDLRFASLGSKSLKNVSAPTGLYRVVMPWEQEQTAGALDKRRVAVLPFTNISPDPNDEYFADGMTEELITTLSMVDGLHVIARTSAMHYKGSPKIVSEIGKELKVGTILEGSVRKAASKIRVTVQLVDTESEEHVWASNYDRQLDDVFGIQTDIANKVAEALKLKLVLPREAKRHAENLGAYTLCLKARFQWNRRTKEAIDQAVVLFEEASKLDPEYARAYAGLADCYYLAANNGYIDREEGRAKAREFVTRSLEPE